MGGEREGKDGGGDKKKDKDGGRVRREEGEKGLGLKGGTTG